MLSKRLSELTAADFQRLIDDAVSERRTLEFKRDLVGPREEDKREFLADASSLANTSGGDLVYGVEETAGVATALRPIALANSDAEIRRLEDILRTGIEPRLPPVEFQWVLVDSAGGMLVIRLPRSWVAPHRVTFRDHSKFYARNNAGKFALDVAQLRAAFTSSEALVERVRTFRRDRIAALQAEEGPVQVATGAKVLLHIIPLSAFTTPLSVPLGDATGLFRPLSSHGFNHHHTLEGFATYTPVGEDGRSDAYTLVFRNGIVEAVSEVGAKFEGKGPFVFASSVEWPLIEAFESYMAILAKMMVVPPFYVALTLCGTRGYTLLNDSISFGRFVRPPLVRDVLPLPEIEIADPAPEPQKALRPLLDMVWQAFGYAKSFNFDAEGKFKGERF